MHHTLIMGVLNVTPDSFSDGGAFVSGGDVDHETAVATALALVAAGADLIDVGGETTRPGSEGVPADVEMARVLPVVEMLADAGVIVSVDTSKAEVARAALDAGAEVVNDVTALRDPAMAEVCALAGCGVVLMHMQGTPRTMQHDPTYDDVVLDVTYALRDAAAAASGAGVDRSRICVDPGIGFGKSYEHNLALLRSVDRIAALGYPVLVGASRKSVLGAILDAAGHPATAARRDAASLATVALAIAGGAAAVRVHDVAGALQAARTADAIVRGTLPID